MNPNEFVQYFITLKRVFYSKPVPLPVMGGRDYKHLAFLLLLLEEQGADPLEYLTVQVKHMKRKNRFPTSEQLLEKKAFARYRRYRKLKTKLERRLNNTGTEVVAH